MKLTIFRYLLTFGSVVSAQSLFAQAVEVTEETKVEKSLTPQSKPAQEVGEKAAQKYFGKSRAPAASSGDRFLSLHVGTFVSENTYKWGTTGGKDVGQLNTGVTYKVGEWTGSMDLMLKADITTYSLVEGRALKLTVLPAVVFPDVNSGFPLYFGAGAGLGVFLKQIEEESSLAFDYTLFAGVRVFDLIEGVGLLVEAGMKNHILLLSDGQYNGVHVNFGAVFRF